MVTGQRSWSFRSQDCSEDGRCYCCSAITSPFIIKARVKPGADRHGRSAHRRLRRNRPGRGGRCKFAAEEINKKGGILGRRSSS